MKELTAAFVEVRPGDLLFTQLKNTGLEMTGDEYMEVLDFAMKHIGEKPYCSLVDARDIHMNFSSKARHLNATHPFILKNKIAEAVISSSLAMKLIVNIYGAFNKPKVPTKIFKDEKSALEWLEEQRMTFKPRNGENGSTKGLTIW
jgi:hypothetical protein